MMKMRQLLLFMPILCMVSCVSKSTYLRLQNDYSRLQKDSMLLEKRIKTYADQVDYLSNKSALVEQTLTQRLQEKEDSLNAKQIELLQKQRNIEDMKARKAQEQEAFTKLFQTIKKPFATLENIDVVSYTNCSQIIIETWDKTIFTANTAKIDASKSQPFMGAVREVLKQQKDLNLLVIAHTDSVILSKEKTEDALNIGSIKANAIVRHLIKDYTISGKNITAGTQGDYVLPSKATQSLGRNRVQFVFSSSLLPCVHSLE
jgi:flagellar motor protein MotB